MGFRDFLKKVTAGYLKFIQKHYWKSLIGYVLIVLFLGYHASKIEIRTDFIDLLPENKESVQNLKTAIEYFGGEGYLIGVVEWESSYKETLGWIAKLQQETEKLRKNLKKNIDRNDSAWLANWHQKKEGQEEIDVLISLYQEIKGLLKDQLSEATDIQDKYLNLFYREINEVVLPDTLQKSQVLKKNPENLKAGLDFFYTLEDNLYAFKAYDQAIRKAKGGEKELISVAEKLATALTKEEDLVKYVEYRFRTNFIKDHLLYFIDEPDLEDIKNRIQNKIDYERRRTILSSSLLADAPVTLDFKDIEKKYEKSTKVLKISTKTDFFEKSTEEYEYYLNKDQDTLILLIKPSKGSLDLAFAEKLFDKSNEIAQNILKDYPKNINVGFTGRYVKKIEDAKIIKNDLESISVLAVILILLSVGVYFRNLRSIFVVGVPLISGITLATGIVSLTIGYFNIITGFLIAILSGLGVDFGVNMFSRFVEERRRGHDVFKALEIVFHTTFLSNFTATATTSAAFFSLLYSDFKGFSQFGFTAGIGMMMIILSILFAFPAILVLADKINPFKVKPTYKPVDRFRNKRLPYYRIVIVIGMAFTLLSIFSVFKTRFNADFYSLSAKNTLGLQLEKKAEKMIKMSLWPVIIYAQDWDTMTGITQKINEMTDQGKLTSLDKIDALSNYIPDNQKEKKKIMLEIKDLLKDSVLSKLKSADEKKKVNRLLEMVDADFITHEEQIPIELHQQFKSHMPGYFLFYYPRSNINMSKSSTIKEFVKDIHEVVQSVGKEKVVIASDAEMFNDVLVMIEEEGPIIIILVLFSILFILWLDFRSIKDVLVSIFPLTVGVLWIFGWNFLMGWNFNYFNIVIFPVIMGLGLDYGVHLYHRYQEEGRYNIRFIVRTTGIAIVVGALTDIFGFGTLLLAYYRGLATMGQVAVAGIFSCAFMGILFVPALLELRKDIRLVGFKKAFTYKTAKLNKIEQEAKEKEGIV